VIEFQFHFVHAEQQTHHNDQHHVVVKDADAADLEFDLAGIMQDLEDQIGQRSAQKKIVHLTAEDRAHAYFEYIVFGAHACVYQVGDVGSDVEHHQADQLLIQVELQADGHQQVDQQLNHKTLHLEQRGEQHALDNEQNQFVQLLVQQVVHFLLVFVLLCSVSIFTIF